MSDESKTLSQIFEDIKSGVCDGICKYTHAPAPEGKTEDWLYEDGSPCETCPLNML